VRRRPLIVTDEAGRVRTDARQPLGAASISLCTCIWILAPPGGEDFVNVVEHLDFTHPDEVRSSHYVRRSQHRGGRGLLAPVELAGHGRTTSSRLPGRTGARHHFQYHVAGTLHVVMADGDGSTSAQRRSFAARRHDVRPATQVVVVDFAASRTTPQQADRLAVASLSARRSPGRRADQRAAAASSRCDRIPFGMGSMTGEAAAATRARPARRGTRGRRSERGRRRHQARPPSGGWDEADAVPRCTEAVRCCTTL
jgi:hypothetical protein